MTVKELYEQACMHGKENLPLVVDYTCSDDCYDFNEEVKIKNINFDETNTLEIDFIAEW